MTNHENVFRAVRALRETGSEIERLVSIIDNSLAKISGTNGLSFVRDSKQDSGDGAEDWCY